MGQRGGGGAWSACCDSCAVLAAALVVSALVIRGAVGQAVPPSQMISSSIQTANPHLQEQVSAASPSRPVQPHVPHPKIAVNPPAVAPFSQQPPWSSQPPPSPPSTGSQSTQPAPSPRINAHSAPSSHTSPTGQQTSRVPVASPPAELPSQRKPPPKAVPPTSITPASSQDKDGISAARPPNNLPRHNSSPPKGPAVSPSNSPSIHRRGHGIIPVAAPRRDHSSHLPPANHRHHKGSFPVISPAPRRADNASATSHGHSGLSHSSAPAPAPVGLPPSKGKGQRNPAYAPHHPHHYHSPSYSPEPALPPVHLPDSPAFKNPKALAPAPSQSLPRPPPNSYCTPLSCQDPLTNSPPGTTCLCVSPIKVGLHLDIALHTFFALVSELAQEISYGVLMKQSQVRVMGANSATEDPERTVVLIDLVPLGAKFDNTTALLVFERFWHKQVFINPMYFGNYDVLYVLYPGLPSSPPTAPGSMNNSLSNVNGPRLHPLAVDVGNHRERKGRGIIVIIVLSSVFTFILCAGAALVIYFKLRNRNHLTEASLTPAKPAVLALKMQVLFLLWSGAG